MCKGKVVERPVAMQFWGRLLYGDGKEALQSCPSAQNLGGYGSPHLAVTLNILLDGLALFGGQTLEIQSYDLTWQGRRCGLWPEFSAAHPHAVRARRRGLFWVFVLQVAQFA